MSRPHDESLLSPESQRAWRLANDTLDHLLFAVGLPVLLALTAFAAVMAVVAGEVSRWVLALAVAAGVGALRFGARAVRLVRAYRAAAAEEDAEEARVLAHLDRTRRPVPWGGPSRGR